jgi:putative addiction module component (TIGR02574 family)
VVKINKALLQKQSLEAQTRGSNMAIIDNVKEEVGRLSINDRAMLAHWIIINLEEIDEPQEAVDAAWREEIRDRIKEIRTGKVRMIPADEMWKDILKDYSQKN